MSKLRQGTSMKTAQKVTKLDSVRIVKSRYSWFIESLFFLKKDYRKKKKKGSKLNRQYILQVVKWNLYIFLFQRHNSFKLINHNLNCNYILVVEIYITIQHLSCMVSSNVITGSLWVLFLACEPSGSIIPIRLILCNFKQD